MKSIRSKILLCMTLTVFISLLLVGAVSVYLNITSTNDTLKQSMRQMAEVAAARVEQELIANINIAVETGCVARIANPDTSVAEKGIIIDQRVQSHGLQRGNIIGLDGISLLDGKDYSDREYFQEAVKGLAHVSEPLVSKITGELTIIVAAPLWEGGIPNTRVVGVVYFVPPESFLNDIVKSIQVSRNGGAYILSAEGVTIAHADMEKVKNEENIGELAKTNSSLKGLAALNQRMVNQENDFDVYTYNGEQKFLAFAPIGSSDGWSIGINAPNSDFMDATYLGIFIIFLILLLACLAAFFIAMRLANGIGKPMARCTERLELLAQGDLNAPVPQVTNKDETGRLATATQTIVTVMSGIITDLSWGLGQLANGDFTVDSKVKELYVGDFRQMAGSMYQIIEKLSGTLSRVREAANQVSGGSEQVSSGAQALSQGATEQASSVQELAATINEITGQLDINSNDAQEAREVMDRVGEEMTQSNQKMQDMITAMDEISQSSTEIGKIIKTIEDIAFQTNILALNAAVEAARAGAAGKGFAVVADEVRNLASKSAEASKNTSGLIEGALRAVKNGTAIADDTAKTLLVAVEGAQKATGAVDRITAATNEQARSMTQVSQGIDQISSVVQTNSATAEESAAASEELSSQAQMLNDLVGTFKLREEEARPTAANTGSFGSN